VSNIAVCVLILLWMCPHTAVYVSSYYYMRAQRALQDSILLHMCPHTAICVRILLCVPSISHELVFLFFYFRWRTRSPRSRTACYYICVFILRYRPHTAMCVCQDHARTGGREEHAAGHQRCRRVLNNKSKKKKNKKRGEEKKMEKKEGFLLRFKCMCRICPQLATDTEARRCREAAAPYVHIYMPCNRR
jgi:hypothetical protein